MWHAWERGEKCAECCCEIPKDRDHLEDRGIDGRMGLEWILGRLAGGMDLTHLHQDRNSWWAFVNALMDLRLLASRSYLVIYTSCSS
jgi:hypothetical protein